MSLSLKSEPPLSQAVRTAWADTSTFQLTLCVLRCFSLLLPPMSGGHVLVIDPSAYLQVGFQLGSWDVWKGPSAPGKR